MLIRHHEPLGNLTEKPQDPLPENWKELAGKSGHIPARFDIVDEDKLFRSAIVWPHQVKHLRDNYGISNIVSLMDGDWLSEFYENSEVEIHQFPFLQRRALTYNRIRGIVDVINESKRPCLVHCLKGSTRTGMVCAGYNIINGNKGKLASIAESVKYGMVNISSIREMLYYSK